MVAVRGRGPCAKTYFQSFYLGHYGHYMPKHSTTWSNSAVIRTLARGRWDKLAKQSSKSAASGVVTYKDKKGRKRCHGTPQLKRSQSLDY